MCTLFAGVIGKKDALETLSKRQSTRVRATRPTPWAGHSLKEVWVDGERVYLFAGLQQKLGGHAHILLPEPLFLAVWRVLELEGGALEDVARMNKEHQLHGDT